MGYFADIPKFVKEMVPDLIGNGKKFGERFPQEIKDRASEIKNGVKDFAQAKLFYDGCNAGVRFPDGTVTFYRNKYCQPPSRTIPLLTKRDEIENIGDKCGNSISFGYTYGGSGINASGQENPFSYKVVESLVGDFPTWLNSSGGTGEEISFRTPDGSSAIIYPTIGNRISTDGSPWDGEKKFYSFRGGGGSIGLSSSAGMSQFLSMIDDFFSRNIEIYDFEVNNPNADGCPINQPTGSDPPPPPRKEECDCMACCPQFDDTLLKLILKRIGNLPANVPDNFTKQNPAMMNIESLAELMLWQMQQLDALMGAYPIEIEIEDSDLTKEGSQKEKITIPNQAEGMAELLGMALTIKRDTHATLITAIKAMAEAGMSKQLGVKTLDVALSNAEFLGYKLEQKKKNIPSLFTPNGKNLTETLQEKEVEIITYENTDNKDLQDDLKKLLEMAARWNAQNWRRVTGDPVEALRQMLLYNTEAVQEQGVKREQDDFDNFTERAERGFTDISGITDVDDPWGRSFTQRPKIREIGTEKGRYDAEGKEIPKI